MFPVKEKEPTSYTQSLRSNSQILIDSKEWKKLSDLLYDYGHASFEERAALFCELELQLKDLYKKLLKNPEYRNALYAADINHDTDEVMHRYKIVHDPLMQIEIISLHGSYPSPLHDYPGQCGLFFCISGAVILTQYHQCQNAISRCYPITRLDRAECCTLNPGDTIALDPEYNNILEWQPYADHSILFSVRYQWREAPCRHMFFPITPPRKDQASFFARRMQRYN